MRFGFAFSSVDVFSEATKWITRHSQIIMKIGAVIMVVMGLILLIVQISCHRISHGMSSRYMVRILG
ncbi:hypothetical protein [Bacillus sp. SD088]|uniref:hypothetical protein n=1 Tax=Bacillus sp. SD088 TaxID=2782012 RepID=UPI001A966B97|nr:hypothetical protein [Bacillus sp. SD088]MBO0994376.1 hypothetical protein [Bacillus sp. SD088]